MKAGEKVHFRVLLKESEHVAQIWRINQEYIILNISDDAPSRMKKGEYVVVFDRNNHRYYTQVTGVNPKFVKLMKLGEDKRGSFRMLTVLPLSYQKIRDVDGVGQSRILLSVAETTGQNVPEDFVNPALRKLLEEINSKLSLLVEQARPESENVGAMEERLVSISGSGMRFTPDEKINTGSVLEIKIGLKPGVIFLAYGRVVRSADNGKGPGEVALHFIDIDDRTKDELLRCLLDRQREAVRALMHGSKNSV